jgi:predicted Zn-dependent peptidase
MSSIARNELAFGRHVPEEEIVAGLDAVTIDDICALSATVLDFDRAAFAAVGNVASEDAYRAVLND